MKEGFEAGQLGVFPDAGDTPAPSNFGGTHYDYYADEDFENERLDSADGSTTTEDLYPDPPQAPSAIPPSRSGSSMIPPNLPRPPSINSRPPSINPRPASIAPPTQPRDTPAPLPVPPPVPGESAPLSPLFTPFHDIHPIPVHNEAPQPRHEHIDVPPDGYIPTTGPDGFVQIPPAHEFLFQRNPSAPRSNGSVVEQAPSTFVGAMSPRSQHTYTAAPSVRAESVRRAPSAAGFNRPVQMPTPRMNTNLPGIERQAQRSSWSSDFYGGGQASQPPFPVPSSDSSDSIPINIQPPSRQSYASGEQVGTPSMGNNLFGPGIGAADSRGNGMSLPRRLSVNVPGSAQSAASQGAVPLGFQQPTPSTTVLDGPSPMPGAYAAPSEGPGNGYDPYAPTDPDHESESTHSSDFQTSTPDTLTTPPGQRRYHPHKPGRVKNPAAYPGYSKT
ncbi:hypothetical protein K438DRAFT_1982818 [Mycena galopus ATCC 62051]|nr:hypothetical protein K438DRAFT_1982818 [Mycena galopus ATCC 62051]